MTVKTREQIAIELGISVQTLRRWLRKEGIVLSRRLISTEDQILIYKTFGAVHLYSKANGIETITT